MEAAIGISLIGVVVWLLLRPTPKKAVNPQHWAMAHNQLVANHIISTGQGRVERSYRRKPD